MSRVRRRKISLNARRSRQRSSVQKRCLDAISLYSTMMKHYQRTSADASGIQIFQYFISVSLTAIASGIFMTKFRIYVPLLVLEAAIMVAGSALIHTLTVKCGPAQWIGYQLLIGIGYGMGFQYPLIAVQVVLGADDIRTGCALTLSFQARGCALAFCVAQNMFSGTQMSSTNSGGPYKCVLFLCKLPFSGYKVQHLVNGYKFWFTPRICVTLSCRKLCNRHLFGDARVYSVYWID